MYAHNAADLLNAAKATYTVMLMQPTANCCTQGLGWVEEMLRLTVAPAVAETGSVPRIIHADELEFMDKAWWLAFEHVVVANDRWAALSQLHASFVNC